MQQPERVEAMILIGSSMYITGEERAWERQLSADEISEGLRERHKHGEDQIRALMTQMRNFKDSYDDVNFTPPLPLNHQGKNAHSPWRS